jgi:carboxymethylenebutenolidase
MPPTQGVFVSENDSAIVVDQPQLRRPDGVLESYAAYPKSVRPETPGVVVVMHAYGVDAHIRDVVRRFAKAGFTAIAPNLYTRFKAPAGDGATDLGAFAPYQSQLQRRQYAGDLRASALHLLSKAPQCKIGIAGFDIGAHMALLQAVDNADVFDAVASFYGAVREVDPLEIHVPVCGSYAEKDAIISPDEVRVWRSALRVGNDFRIYPQYGHGFFDETRSSYVPSAADDAWKRTFLFFKTTLGLST